MERLGGQRGQTTAEYMGLLVLVGAIIAALAASGLGTMVTAGVERAICLSVGDGPCPTVQAQLAQGGEEDDEVREDAQQRERRELERARAEFKDVQARAMTAMAGSTRPLSEVQGQSPGDWVLSGLGELSGVNDADRGVTQLGEGDILGGAFSLAMAWPGAKAFKLGKEGIEEGIEQVTRDGAQQAGEAGGRRSTRGRPGPCSFAARTPVLMADGTHKAIELVRVGDEVIATDPTTGQRHARAVMARWAHLDRTVRLTVGGETLTTTADHPFYNTTDGAWQTVHALDIGDRLANSDGDLVAVQAIGGQSPTPQTAYNLTVQHTHTYHVGERGILVHNECVPADFAAPPVRRTPSGEVTNGRYTVRTEAQARHTTGSTTSGKSQFLFRVDADQAVLDASAYADDAGLWVNNRAKVRVGNGPVGILGESGQPTDWVNLYRTKSGPSLFRVGLGAGVRSLGRCEMSSCFRRRWG